MNIFRMSFFPLNCALPHDFSKYAVNYSFPGRWLFANCLFIAHVGGTNHEGANPAAPAGFIL